MCVCLGVCSVLGLKRFTCSTCPKAQDPQLKAVAEVRGSHYRGDSWDPFLAELPRDLLFHVNGRWAASHSPNLGGASWAGV